MFKEYVLLFACLIICLSCISTVVAIDANNTTDVDDYQVIGNQEFINDSDIICDGDSKSFSDLRNDVDSNDYLTFESDYVFIPKDSYRLFVRGIDINERDVVIDGNNHVIDCKNECSVFNITQSTVVFKNIKFLNAEYLIPPLEFIGGRYVTPSYNWYGYGGFIHAKNSNVTIINCTFINGTAKLAGAFHADNSSVLIENSVFNNCTGVNGGGGAVFIESGYTIVKGSCFVNNTSNTQGGGLTLSKGEIINCDFKGNKANRSGGGVYLSNGTIFNCNFINNTSYKTAGAVEIREGEIFNSNFSYNTADSDGSAVYSYCPMVLNIVNCSFNNNTGKGKGTVYGVGEVVGCTFIGNKVDYAAGVYFDHRDDFVLQNTIKDSAFINNTVVKMGGAVYCERVNLTVNDSVFINNTANYGGAVYAITDLLLFDNLTFENNYGKKSGNVLSGVVGNGSIVNSTNNNLTSKDITVDGNTTNLILFTPEELMKQNEKHNMTNTTNNTDDVVNNMVNNNTNIENSTNNINNHVVKITPKLTVKKATYKVKKSIKKYTAIIKTDKNKPLKKVKLYLKVKSKTYKSITNKHGKAVFKIKNLKKKGTFKAVIFFKGDNVYNSVKKSVKIKCK